MKNKKIQCSEEDHIFIYSSKDRRKCEKCGKKEIFFGNKTLPIGVPYEDWREST